MKLWQIFVVLAVIAAVVISVKIQMDLKAMNEEVAKSFFLQSQASEKLKKQLASGQIGIKEAIAQMNREMNNGFKVISGQVSTGFSGIKSGINDLRTMNRELASSLQESKQHIARFEKLNRETQEMVRKNRAVVAELSKTTDEIKSYHAQLERSFDELARKQQQHFLELKERTRKKILGLIPVGD